MDTFTTDDKLGAGATSISTGDRVGLCASGACAVHCAAAPLVLLFVPAIGGIWTSPWVHAVLAVIVLPLALLVIGRGYRLHRRRWVLAAAAIGAVLIVAGMAVEHPPVSAWAQVEAGADAVADHMHEEGDDCAACCPTVVAGESGHATLRIPLPAQLTLLGSVCLIAAHAGNLVSLRRCHESCV